MAFYKPVNAIGYAGIVLFVGAFAVIVIASGSAHYHGIASFLVRWRTLGTRELFWPKIQDVEYPQLPISYLLHRNKMRRAGVVAMAAFLFGWLVLLASIFWGSREIPPGSDGCGIKLVAPSRDQQSPPFKPCSR